MVLGAAGVISSIWKEVVLGAAGVIFSVREEVVLGAAGVPRLRRAESEPLNPAIAQR